MADLTLEQWPLDQLIPYVRNPRRNDEQVDRMAAAIREFGFRVPVLAQSDGTIVDGHLRLKAAHKLGMDSIPVILADGLTPAQVKAFRLLANRSVNWAEWDTELLSLELNELKDLDFDLNLTGFDDDELTALLAEGTAEGNTDPDDVPEVQEDAVAVLGDVWICGKHRLVCGDCTDPLVVDKAMNGVQPHLMVTDPPYGVEYDADWRSSLDSIDRATGRIKNDNRADWREVWALFPGDVAYVWHAGIESNLVAEGLAECGLLIRSQIIWVKPHFVISRGHYHVQHEPCWYAVRKSANGHWSGDRKQSTIWKIDNALFQGRDKNNPENAKTGHGTQKPVECMRRPIENNSSPGQAVYDPFLGSGTTMIAAEITSRVCHGIEIDERYIDCAIRRWQNFTGQSATLEGDGRSFDEIAGHRLADRDVA